MSVKTINALIKKHGAKQSADIKRGIKHSRAVWDFKKKSKRNHETEFHTFCLKHYTPPGRQRRELVEKLDYFINSVGGYFGMMSKAGRRGLDIADHPLSAADELFASFSGGSHYLQDLRDFQIAALAQLNFGTDSLTPPKTRIAWAERRLSSVGREVVPAKLLAESAKIAAANQKFVSDFNIHLDRIDFGDKEITFPKNTRLLSHWGLRDYMMGLNGTSGALKKQRAIRDILRRIVDGHIPREALDNPAVKWDIRANTVAVGGKKRKATPTGALRWEEFKKVMDIRRKIDPYTRYGNMIDNKFKLSREIEEKKIVGMLTDILRSPLAGRVGAYVSGKLGRALEAHDIYYKGFRGSGRGSGRGSVQKSKLRYDLAKKYPDSASLTKSLPDVLQKMGFTKKRAQEISSKIRVDNSRSAGHAWRPYAKEDMQLLRVRVDKTGITEQDYSVFMHELGHCVESVISSYGMDYQALWGTPNTAFTEAFAFTFQDRTDQILGRKIKENRDVTNLQRYWEVYEIAGPALTEIEFFHWLYKNPRATPAQMNRKIRAIGDKIWAKYYAPVLGAEGFGLMSVYSHILWCIFYLADYPLGYIIAYQVRKFLRGKNLAREMERMCGLGDIYPEQWMRQAVGENISVKPLLTDVAASLKRLGF